GGPVAEDIVSYLRRLGTLHAHNALVQHSSEHVTPIISNYRSTSVCQIPPNNKGITALIMLNVLTGYALRSPVALSIKRLPFDSGIVTPNTGIVLQNRGTSFRVDPRHPNCIGPGKRPLHTIMPGMVMQADRVLMPYGVMGGDYQPFGHTHFLTNVLDFGCDLQEALDLARVFYAGGAVQVERGVSRQSALGLTTRGHRVELSPEPFGGGHAIWID